MVYGELNAMLCGNKKQHNNGGGMATARGGKRSPTQRPRNKRHRLCECSEMEVMETEGKSVAGSWVGTENHCYRGDLSFENNRNVLKLGHGDDCRDLQIC